MAPIRVHGWDYRDGRWTKDGYVVTRVRTGLRAFMADKDRMIPIGTCHNTDVPAFLDKVDHFITLKDVVYA